MRQSIPGTAAVRWSMRGQDSLRSEEHTSELQSPVHLVCRLLLEKKNNRRQRAQRSQMRAEQVELHDHRVLAVLQFEQLVALIWDSLTEYSEGPAYVGLTVIPFSR